MNPRPYPQSCRGPIRQLSAARAAFRPRIFSAQALPRRHASTAADDTSNRLRNFIYGTSLVALASVGYIYFTDTRASIHQYIAPPLLRFLYSDAEDAHKAGTKLMKELWTFGLHPRERGRADQDGMISVEVFGQTLANPVGISGGLDKNAEVPDPLLALGPGLVEIGGVTPLPQDGNPKPRVFRLESQNAIINRYGLNSEGADVVAMRLRQRLRDFAYQHGFGIDEAAERLVLDDAAGVPPGSLIPGRFLAVQIAKNKVTPDSDLDAVVWDHVYCVQQLGKYADILVVNVSSPNTPGLRSLQSQEPLTKILSSVVAAAQAVPRKTKPKVMVKVSPDENSESEIQGICDAVWDAGVDGVIVGNTTKRRPEPLPKGYVLPDREATTLLEQGGFSGPQLFPGTLDLVKKYRKTLDEGPRVVEEPMSSGSTNNTASPSPSPDLAGPGSAEGLDSAIVKKIESGVKRDEANLKPLETTEPEPTQPLIQLPERHDSSSDSPSDAAPAVSMDHHVKQTSTVPSTDSKSPAPVRSKAQALSSEPKVIFASGGITNGEQALEVLNAGASVAMIYTAMTYGGVGTVGRIKQEMRDNIKGGSAK
jgi:dihydroorotate dehydrogenase